MGQSKYKNPYFFDTTSGYKINPDTALIRFHTEDSTLEIKGDTLLAMKLFFLHVIKLNEERVDFEGRYYDLLFKDKKRKIHKK